MSRQSILTATITASVFALASAAAGAQVLGGAGALGGGVGGVIGAGNGGLGGSLGGTLNGDLHGGIDAGGATRDTLRGVQDTSLRARRQLRQQAEAAAREGRDVTDAGVDRARATPSQVEGRLASTGSAGASTAGSVEGSVAAQAGHTKDATARMVDSAAHDTRVPNARVPSVPGARMPAIDNPIHGFDTGVVKAAAGTTDQAAGSLRNSAHLQRGTAQLNGDASGSGNADSDFVDTMGAANGQQADIAQQHAHAKVSGKANANANANASKNGAVRTSGHASASGSASGSVNDSAGH